MKQTFIAWILLVFLGSNPMVFASLETSGIGEEEISTNVQDYNFMAAARSKVSGAYERSKAEMQRVATWAKENKELAALVVISIATITSLAYSNYKLSEEIQLVKAQNKKFSEDIRVLMRWYHELTRV